jgi:hypothetical protein
LETQGLGQDPHVDKPSLLGGIFNIDMHCTACFNQTVAVIAAIVLSKDSHTIMANLL